MGVVCAPKKLKPIGLFYGYASKTLKLELLIVPIWINELNRPLLVVNSYSTFAGNDFDEFLTIILMTLELADKFKIWVLGVEDGNYSIGQDNHYNKSNAKKFIAATRRFGVEFLQNENEPTTLNSGYIISHLWSNIPKADISAFIPKIVIPAATRDVHGALWCRVFLRNCSEEVHSKILFEQECRLIFRTLHSAVSSHGSASVRLTGDEYGGTLDWQSEELCCGTAVLPSLSFHLAPQQQIPTSKTAIIQQFDVVTKHSKYVLDSTDYIELSNTTRPSALDVLNALDYLSGQRADLWLASEKNKAERNKMLQTMETVCQLEVGDASNIIIWSLLKHVTMATNPDTMATNPDAALMLNREFLQKLHIYALSASNGKYSILGVEKFANILNKYKNSCNYESFLLNGNADEEYLKLADHLGLEGELNNYYNR